MKIGTVGYATERGLGRLVKDFHDHGVVTDVCVVLHGRVPDHSAEWYSGSPVISSLKDLGQIEMAKEFCRGKDAMLFFETPFIWELVPFCRSIGVKTFLVTMHECTPVEHERPDCYLCPSKLDLQYFGGGACPPPFFPTDAKGDVSTAALVQLPIEMPWKRRDFANYFVHNGGYLGLRGREGTTLLIEAMRHVKSGLKLTIRVQEDVGPEHRKIMDSDSRIEYKVGTFPHSDLYGEGDVAVLPQKFNGCSLPLQEARASGMLVMTTDRYPANDWLNGDGALITVSGSRRVKIGGPYMEFDEVMIDPREIAFCMDAWHAANIGRRSELGKVWAERNNWAALKPRWMEVLSS